MSGVRSSSSSWLRRVFHGLLGALLLLGAVDLHPAEELHFPLVPSGESLYFPAAAHPGQPVHFEAAHYSVQQPHCSACLHRLETRAEPLRLIVAAVPYSGGSKLWLAPAPRADRGGRRPDGARAPPLFS